MKSLVRLLVIPEASIQEIVIEWDPGESGVGTLQLHDPLLGIARLSLIGFSECTVIVIFSPAGPLPKNSG